MADADVVLLVVDAASVEETGGISEEDRAVLERGEAGGRSVLVVWNKSDLVAGVGCDAEAHISEARCGAPGEVRGLTSQVSEASPFDKLRAGSGAPGDKGQKQIPFGNDNKAMVRTSALTGEGIEELRAAIVQAVAGDGGGLREAGMLTNLRQHQAVEQALRGLDTARATVVAAIPHEMVLLDLYEALRGLDALTGATSSEDVLRLIFSTFCIGK
jgi:tRNA modification GTPase